MALIDYNEFRVQLMYKRVLGTEKITWEFQKESMKQMQTGLTI